MVDISILVGYLSHRIATTSSIRSLIKLNGGKTNDQSIIQPIACVRHTPVTVATTISIGCRPPLNCVPLASARDEKVRQFTSGTKCWLHQTLWRLP